MSISLFKSQWKIYKSWLRLTGTLKKTKKDCWLDYKRERNHYVEPAKITPKVISEAYDEIKEFLQKYFEPCDYEDRTDRTWSIYTSSDYAEYTLHSRCHIVIRDKEENLKYDSRDYMQYNTRRRLSLAFFDNIKPYDEYDERYIVDLKNTEHFRDVLREDRPFVPEWNDDETVDIEEAIPF